MSHCPWTPQHDTTVAITYSDGEVVREEPWPQARLLHRSRSRERRAAGALARIGGGQRLRLRYGVGNVAGQWQIQLGQKQMHLLHKTLAEQAPGAGGRTGRGPT